MNINVRESFACGSHPEELYNVLKSAYATFYTECSSCGKILISIKDIRTGEVSRGNFKAYSFFNCTCGKKIKKVALDFDSGGYKCKQALVEKPETEYLSRIRPNKNKGPKPIYLHIYLSHGRTLVYRVLPTSIKYQVRERNQNA